MKAIITTTSRFMASDNRLYFRVSGKTAIGILKVGVKKLFIRTDMGQIKEISPLCVLDFYVHESAQRSGQGRVRSTLAHPSGALRSNASRLRRAP